MGKVCNAATPIYSVNGIVINKSKPCSSSNYTNMDERNIEYIVMHYTGNEKDNAKNNANYFMGLNRGASAHYFVDDDSIWQSVDINDKAWHCGTTGTYYHSSCRNTNSIGIEMCCTAGNYKVSEKTKENAAHLAAALCKYLGITDVDKYVVRHYDVTHKYCPAQMKGDNNAEWIAFKKKVKEILNIKNETVTNPVSQYLYRVRKSWDDAKSQVGAFSNLQNAKSACDKAGVEYKVYDNDGKVVYVPNEDEKLDTSHVNTSAADPKYMWNYFKSKGLNDYGIAGLMGNLYAESGLRACNLQNSYEKSLNMTDAEYTVAVDIGKYDNFVYDKAGYGLAQWTYWSLKRDMLDYFKKKNKSIGDLDTQMEFLAHQLSTGYKDVWNTLKTAAGVLDASNAVLLKFERPADQSESMQKKRAEFGQKYFDLYAVNVQVEQKELYRVRKSWENEKSQIGAYSDLNNAKKACDNAGYGYYVFDKAGKVIYPVVTTSTEFKVGDVIELSAGAKYTSGKSIPGWVIKSKLYVREIHGDNIVFSILKVGPVTGVVNKKYIMNGEQEPKKSVTEIAKEVIQGKWGNGDERRKRLKAAGYDPDEIQKQVNKML